MIRVLHVIGRMGSGGAETMIMNLYRKIDRSQIQFDFVVHTDEKAFYDDEILALGGKIYSTNRYNIVNYFSYKKFWDEFFEQHPEYQIVHGHINSSAAVYLSSAKRHGRIAVVHSHATRNTKRNLRAYVFDISVYPIRFIADYFWGCSLQAGLDRFGKNVVDADSFRILNNGIETEKYAYSPQNREKIRSQYKISNEAYIVGHVGRFTYAKNHDFLIDTFEKLHQTIPDSKLMLVGEGELENTIREKVRTLHLETDVIFVGQVKNVCDYLQAMDVFVFPSAFEGLGIALIEAQAAGLPCVVSENIQQEAKLPCDLVHTLNISDGAKLWAEQIQELRGTKRKDTSQVVKDAGFDIEESAKTLQEFYQEISRK